MSINTVLKKFLEKNQASFKESQHPTTYTASETAAAQHTPGDMVLKPVIVKDRDHFWMCVISAAQRLDFDKLKQVLGDVQELQLASEEEINERFPDFEPGAEPPFGQFGEMELLLDEGIIQNDQVIFNGGTHRDAIKMSREEYQRIAEPELCAIANHL